jgi:ribose 1,5-bisphosphokinase PhnN
MNAHPGFAKVASRIAAKQGISKGAASAILANSSRHASPAAKRKNPRLKRVAMKAKKKG